MTKLNSKLNCFRSFITFIDMFYHSSFYTEVISRIQRHTKQLQPETHETHTGDGPGRTGTGTGLSPTLWSGADPQIQPLARLHMVFFFLNEPKWTKSRTGADCLH